MTLLRFSTRDIPEKDRIAVMRENYAAIENVDIEFIDDAPLVAEAATRILPGVTIMESSCSPCISRRTARHVADGKDDAVLCIVSAGTVEREFDGGETEVFGPGEAYLGFNGRPSQHRLLQGAACIDIAFPRAVLADVVSDAASATGIRLSSTSEIRLLTQYVLALTQDFEELPPDAEARHASHVLDLAAMAIGPTSTAAMTARTRGVESARLGAIKADILANIARPDLSIATIAARHGVSPQYIRALFNRAGTTFGDYVLSSRLGYAHRKLTDPHSAGRRISAVAYEAGFGDLSYFNRTFRRQYGMTPSDARAAPPVPRPRLTQEPSGPPVGVLTTRVCSSCDLAIGCPLGPNRGSQFRRFERFQGWD